MTQHEKYEKELTVKASFMVIGALAAVMENGGCGTRITENRMRKKTEKEIDHPRRLLARKERKWKREREERERERATEFFLRKGEWKLHFNSFSILFFGKKIIFFYLMLCQWRSDEWSYWSDMIMRRNYISGSWSFFIQPDDATPLTVPRQAS